MIKLGERATVYVLFAIVVLTCSLGGLSQTATNSVIPAICQDLSVDIALAQLLTSGYMLGIGVTVPLMTFLSRRLSTRSIVYLALCLLLTGALIDGFATNFLAVFLGRVMQSVSTGITLPFLQAIAMQRFPEGQHATAMGIGGIAMGFAPNVGPSVGGALVDTFGWRSFFFLLSIVVLILGAATQLFVRKDDSPGVPASLDVLSFVLSTLGFGGLLLGFTFASNVEFTHPLVWGPLLVGACSLVAFVIRQKRIPDPLINMNIFGSRHFRWGLFATSFLFVSFMAITLIVPLYVTGVCGGTAADAGMVFVPATVCAIFVNPLAGVFSDKFGVRPVCVVGGILMCAGASCMAFITQDTPLWLTTFFQTVRAIGVSTVIGPLTAWSLSGLKGPIMMDGSAFLATVRQAAASLGVACMVFAITALVPLAAEGDVALAIPYQVAFGISAAAALICFGTVLVRVRN